MRLERKDRSWRTLDIVPYLSIVTYTQETFATYPKTYDSDFHLNISCPLLSILRTMCIVEYASGSELLMRCQLCATR